MFKRSARSGAREGRGLGPFSSGHLTIIVVVFIAVMIPTAALAASGAFTSSTVDPAVSAINSSPASGAAAIVAKSNGTGATTRYGVKGTASGTGGVGVVGVGTKYGVLSNGPLGVAAGSSLSCSGCVGASALAESAKDAQPLASGESESGAFAMAGGDSTSGYMADSIAFARPVLGGATVRDGSDAADCPHFGTAAPGFLCLYGPGSPFEANDAFDAGVLLPTSGPATGADIRYLIGGSPAFILGEWTLTSL